MKMASRLVYNIIIYIRRSHLSSSFILKNACIDFSGIILKSKSAIRKTEQHLLQRIYTERELVSAASSRRTVCVLQRGYICSLSSFFIDFIEKPSREWSLFAQFIIFTIHSTDCRNVAGLDLWVCSFPSSRFLHLLENSRMLFSRSSCHSIVRWEYYTIQPFSRSWHFVKRQDFLSKPSD